MKFTKQGEIVLSVEMLAQTEAEVTLRFQVRDTGLGIPEQEMQKLFDEFTQVDATHRRQYGGTGLGLSIVKRLLALMGSQIQVSSTYGKGSVFFFDVALKKAGKRADGVHVYREHFAQWTVLLADKDTCYQGILDHVLSSWGSACDVCVSSTEVVQRLKQKHYDILLISQSLLDEILSMNTPTFWHQSAHRMVMMIPNHTQVHWDLREHYGLDGFVRKPIFSRSLAETLLSVMGIIKREKRVHERQEAVGERPERILLAEDNPVNQQVAVGMLQQLGWVHVDVVENGLEAVERVKKKVYDLILMDIHMPVMDGWTACREIRALESVQGLAHVPVLALTAHTMSNEDDMQHAGMNERLSKPLTGKALKATLARFLPMDGVLCDAHDEAPKADMSMPLDADALRALWQDLGFGIGMIIDTFVQQWEPEWQAMQTAMTEQDGDALRRCAHKMKGGSRSLSAMRMGDVCEELERLAAKGDMLSAAPLLLALKAEMDEVKNAFEEDWVHELRT